MSKSPTTTKRTGPQEWQLRIGVTTHPGEGLSEAFLKPLGLLVNALTMALRVPATRIGAIINGEWSVSAAALRLARYFQTSPEFWTGLQAVHDLIKAPQGTRPHDRARCAPARGGVSSSAADRYRDKVAL
jgi:addiction module HigA family antidote